LDKLVLKTPLTNTIIIHDLKGRMYFSIYQKSFTLSFTRFTHFTLKIYAEFFTLFTRYCFTFYVLRFLPTAVFHRLLGVYTDRDTLITNPIANPNSDPNPNAIPEI